MAASNTPSNYSAYDESSSASSASPVDASSSTATFSDISCSNYSSFIGGAGALSLSQPANATYCNPAFEQLMSSSGLVDGTNYSSSMNALSHPHLNQTMQHPQLVNALQHSERGATLTGSSAHQNALPTCPTPKPAPSGKGKRRKHSGVDKKIYQTQLKPIIERQRRARINSSLEELHSLMRESLLPSQQSGSSNSSEGSNGSNQRRIEKADILDQAVRFIKSMKGSTNGTFSAPLPSSSSNGNSQSSSSSSSSSSSQSKSQLNGLQLAAIQQAFIAGYAECTRITTGWLATYQENNLKMIIPRAVTSNDATAHHLSFSGIDEHDTDSLDDDEHFLRSDDDDHAEATTNSVGQQLRAKLEDHLISQLNDRVAAHLSKVLPSAASLMTTQGRGIIPPSMQQQLIPTPPQSPKDLLLPFSLAAAAANGTTTTASTCNALCATSCANMLSTNQLYQQTGQQGGGTLQQQYPPASAFSVFQQPQGVPNDEPAALTTARGQLPPSTMYYDEMPQTSSMCNIGSNARSSSVQQLSVTDSEDSLSSSSSQPSSSLTPLVEFMDSSKDTLGFNNANVVFNSFVAQLQQTQRVAAAAGLYCWRPWD